jgi:uncharacterized membrane protein YbhN (UPF0104 family)
MRFTLNPRRVLPIVVAIAAIAIAARVLVRTFRHVSARDVIAQLHTIGGGPIAIAAVLVLVLYSALAFYEAIIARALAGPVSGRRAMLGALLAAPIGHVVGWGTVSGGAIRYRLYRAVLMRPLDIGKFVLLAAMPYPLGLGLMLGLSGVLQSEPAAHILGISPELARGCGLAFLAIHLGYLTLIMKRRGPLVFGQVTMTLPPPRLTAIQYLVGIIEVTSGASVLYTLLPEGIAPPFIVFLGVYVLSIIAGLVSSVPAGLGVFEAVLVTLLPGAPKESLIAAVIAYRFLLEFAPFVIAVTLLVTYEAWWRLPRQRRRRDDLQREHDRLRDL